MSICVMSMPKVIALSIAQPDLPVSIKYLCSSSSTYSDNPCSDAKWSVGSGHGVLSIRIVIWGDDIVLNVSLLSDDMLYDWEMNRNDLFHNCGELNG